MKAIVLCAGQGRRLLPLTRERPKCLLPVDGGRPILAMQLGALVREGVERATVVVGFGAEHAERFLAATPIPGLAVDVLYNPFYAFSDNLVSCWLARAAMTEDFLLLNGDTLFEDAVLARLLSRPPAPATLMIDRKGDYDEDDMKVALDRRGRVRAIGKTLALSSVAAESIGLMRFCGPGVRSFAAALDDAIRRPRALRAWYVAALNELAQRVPVDTASTRGLWWSEIDSPSDLERVRAKLGTSCEARAATG